MGYPVCLYRDAGLLCLADHPGGPRPRHHRGCDDQYVSISYYAQLVQDLGIRFLRAHADIVGLVVVSTGSRLSRGLETGTYLQPDPALENDYIGRISVRFNF